MEKEKKIACINSLDLNITKPMTMNTKMELNKLTLMTGTNGSGKSFFLINFYVFTEIATMIVSGMSGDILKGSSQFILENCFTDIDTTGELTAVFEDGQTIKMTADNGQITSIVHTGFEDVKEIVRIRYMSSGLRTFDEMRHYLSQRKMAKQIIDGETTEEIIASMLKTYRLYDVSYMEGVLAGMPLKSPVTDKLNEFLLGMDVKDVGKIIEFNVDYERSDFYIILEDGTKKYMTSFGKGHQSVFNMVIIIGLVLSSSRKIT